MKTMDFDEKFASDSNEQLAYFRTKCQLCEECYQEKSRLPHT